MVMEQAKEEKRDEKSASGQNLTSWIHRNEYLKFSLATEYLPV
jgi:hypothetical protein